MIRQIFNEVGNSKFQILLFIFCIVLATSTFISIESLRFNVENYILEDSKTINGGDVIIESNRAFPDSFVKQLDSLNDTVSNTLSFTSIAKSQLTQESLLSQIRIVDKNYPLYGDVALASGRSYEEVMNSESIIVQQDFLTRTNATIGSVVKLGDKNFTIADVLISEPDYPLSLFQLGPRIILLDDSLEEINLVGDKSRVSYKTVIKTEEADALIATLKPEDERIEIDNNLEANNTLNTFVVNFLVFIKLISLLIILLSGVAISSVIFSYLEDKKDTVAIKKILGETKNKILKFYLTTILLITLFALGLSILISLLFINNLTEVFINIIPDVVNVGLVGSAIFKGFLFSLFIAAVFTLYPIITISELKPLKIIRKEETNYQFKRLWLNILIFVFFIAVVVVEIGIGLTSLFVIIGSLIALGILFLFSNYLLKALKYIRPKFKSTSIRHSLSGLYRVGNKTALIVTTVSLSLTIIFLISFLQLNLENQFISSFPPDAPNVFVVDIPKDQLNGVQEIIGDSIIYPVIRGRLISVNGIAVEEIEKTNGGGDPLTRPYSLTYGNLLESEEILSTREPSSIFVDQWNSNRVQVSILDDVAQRFNGKLGDILLFKIQGVDIDAEVVSIRKRLDQNIGAFFYFTFEEEVLVDAPQTLFSTLKINESEIAPLQNEIVDNFASVTVINAASTAKTVGRIIEQLSNVVKVFTFVSLIAGVLILISSIVATNSQRSKQAVFYRLVGANNKFITRVFLFEYMTIGLISVLISLGLSQLITYLMTKYVLDINYLPLINTSLAYGLITVIAIILIGLAISFRVLYKKPIEFIRENQVE